MLTKQCDKEYNKEYYRKHRAKRLRWQNAYNKRNAEIRKVKQREYYLKHQEHLKAYSFVYREELKEKIKK